MFNLERAISNWRHSLVEAGLAPDVIDELEAHLRDEVDHQHLTVSDPGIAFQNASQLIGDPVQLTEQFDNSVVHQKASGSFLPLSSLVKIASICTVPFAIVMLLSFFRLFDLQSNQIGLLVGWFVFTAVTLAAFLIILRATKRLVEFPASMVNIPFPISRLQRPVLLENARAEALALGHDFIGTEHLLLALLKENSEQDIPLNLNYKSVHSEVTGLISTKTTHSTSPCLPLTPRATKALQIADKEARRHKHPLVTTSHILTGLTREGTGLAAQILKRFHSR